MAQNYFDQFDTAPQQDPVIARDPYKQADEQRKNRDQALQEEAAARAREEAARSADASVRAERSDARQQAEFEGTGGKPTEAQQKTSVLLSRVMKGFNDITAIATDNPEAQSPGFVEGLRGDLMPGGVGGMATRAIAGEDRLRVHDAQRDVLDALLTLSTGAAYTKEQIDGQMAAYFPQYGDTKNQIADKNERMKSLIAAVRINAGPKWGDVEQAISPYMRSLDANVPDGATVKDGKIYDRDGNYIGASPGAPDGPMNTGGGSDGGGPNGNGSGLGDDNRPTSFWRGVGDQFGNAAENLLSFGEQTMGQQLAAQLSGAIVGENPPLGSEIFGSQMDEVRRNSPNQGSMAGNIVGGIAATLPTMLLTKSPTMGGALAGALVSQDARDPLNVAENALIGAAGGKVGELAIRGGANALSKFRKPKVAPDMDVIAAGQRQNIPVRQADARPEMRGKYAAAESTETAGPMIRSARAADEAAMEARVAEVGGQGNISDNYALGGKVQEAGKRYIAKTREQASRLYEKARSAAGDARVTPTNADAALDTNIAELKAAGENSNAAAIKYLQGLRDDIDKGLTLDSVQNIRTNMRGQISERGLTGTDTDRRVMQVIDAMNDDLTAQLPQEASTALRAADGFYRQRQEFINGTLKEFMGSRGNPLSAETAAQRLVSMAQGKGKFDKFSAMWQQLEKTEQADVAATIASSLGRKQNGDFSAAFLIKNLDPNKGINPRTARLIFGKEGAEALADLRVLAQAKGAAMDRLSPSGQAIGKQTGGVRQLLMSAFGFSQGGVVGAVAAPMAAGFLTKMGEQRAARLLLNPDFTKWLRNAPNTTNPKAIDRYFGKLGGISSIAANDNQAFTRALMDHFRKSPGAVSAGEDTPDSRRIPPQ